MALSKNDSSSQQTIVLQNVPPKGPLELKIDSPTDYTALGITVTVSIITAIISAWITITLVDRTNRNLMKSQNKLQKELIESHITQQKNDISTRSRQEWIKDVRNMMTDFLQLATLIPLHSYEFITSGILFNKKEISEERYLSISDKNKKVIADLNNLGMKLDLTLSKDNELDREICTLINEIMGLMEKITSQYIILVDQYKEQPNMIKAIDYIDRPEFYKIIQNIELIKIKTKVLLKNEWERVKNLN